MNRLKAFLFYLFPHHLVSRIMFAFARITWTPLKNRLIDLYLALHPVDMSLAVEPDPHAYPSLNAFFTRALDFDRRPWNREPDVLLCPVEGTVSQAGAIEAGRIIQAKGRSYDLPELVGGDPQLAGAFERGHFATLYLSPRDYHRIHMPVAGRLLETVYIPGRLFSVAPFTVDAVPRLFARNERLVCRFDTPAGELGMVLVGAVNVSAIETVWGGLAGHGRKILRRGYSDDTPVELDRGAEMGRFNLGSTVIVLAPDTAVWDPGLVPGATVNIGQALGRFTPR